jgi:hypothetical protein
MQRRTLGLLLGAAAAYGFYKYSKMSQTDKDNLKAKGKDFLDKQIGGLGNLLGKKQTTPTNNNI